jgi:hypothetical protein
MDEFDDTKIAKLLRLKRYEQPPPGYFENFLHEFHRRQRDELLREPLWRICLERAHNFALSRLNVPSLTSYPAAVAAVLVCAAVISLRVYQSPEPAHVTAQAGPGFSEQVSAPPELSLAQPVATRVFNMQPLRRLDERARAHRAAAPPRYVLDSVPVSYEPTSFRF